MAFNYYLPEEIVQIPRLSLFRFDGLQNLIEIQQSFCQSTLLHCKPSKSREIVQRRWWYRYVIRFSPMDRVHCYVKNDHHTSKDMSLIIECLCSNCFRKALKVFKS